MGWGARQVRLPCGAVVRRLLSNAVTATVENFLADVNLNEPHHAVLIARSAPPRSGMRCDQAFGERRPDAFGGRGAIPADVQRKRLGKGEPPTAQVVHIRIGRLGSSVRVLVRHIEQEHHTGAQQPDLGWRQAARPEQLPVRAAHD